MLVYFALCLNGITIEFEGNRAYCTTCKEPTLIEELEVANDRTFNKLYGEVIGIISTDDINGLL